MNDTNLNEYVLDLKQSATLLNIHEKSLYYAVKNNRITPHKVNGKFYFTENICQEYKKNKYNRRSTQNLEEDEFTISEACKLLNIRKSLLYCLVKYDKIKSYKKSNLRILKLSDLVDFMKKPE